MIGQSGAAGPSRLGPLILPDVPAEHESHEAWTSIRSSFQAITKHLDEVAKQWDLLTMTVRISSKPKTTVLGGKVGGDEPILMLSRPSDVTSASFLTDRSHSSRLTDDVAQLDGWEEVEEETVDVEGDGGAPASDEPERASDSGAADAHERRRRKMKHALKLAGKMAVSRAAARLMPQPADVGPLITHAPSRTEERALPFSQAPAPDAVADAGGAERAAEADGAHVLAGMTIVKLCMLRADGLFDEDEFERIKSALLELRLAER
ncbi:hypothetical protein KFE25_002089 [Diacronema lutheri]|uniref:Uncharacterized protein n=1 Tax=Diacronema lutheri TaxID=2081491 RepID=A0A8J5XKG5_DIALT|nr:hypothetical protein KFE25_002089 [Diacronema lutheri]